MTPNNHLTPSHNPTDPFTTPGLSERGSYEAPTGTTGWATSAAGPTLQPMEMQDQQTSGAPYQSAPAAVKPSFMQRWRAGDERLYDKTLGSIGAGGRRGGPGEKSAAALGTRRRRPAFLCTIILAVLIILVIIAIVVPIAVVFGMKNGNSGSESSSSGGSGGSSSQPQNSGIVTLQNGKYQGTNMPNGITSYLGLQYAAPPTGDLRFAAPQPPVNFTGTKAATKVAPGCHGLGKFSSAEDEDCLYLDLYTPTNATKASKLPVYVFIQGGGLQNSASHYNGSHLIAASGMQMITVTMTYRVNAFGFLASKEIQLGASLNNGLKDIRECFKWVVRNIEQFGGDPNHIVMGGESGGAGAAVQLLTAYGGRDDHLFQAASMESQSVQPVRDVGSSQFQYDYIVGNTSCSGEKDTLSCLRGLSIQELVSAIGNSPFPNGAGGNPVFPYNPVLDNDFVQEYPIEAFSRGHFINVPMIFGDDTDEGTIFVDQKAIQTKTDSENFLRNTFPKINSTMLEKYSAFYNFSDTSSDDYWQKAAMAYGETRYTCPGIQLSNYVAKNNSGKIWNWHYDVEDPALEAAGLGVKHGSELTAIWGVAANSPVSYQANQENANVVPLMQGYWTSFIKHYDPNVERMAGAPTWEAWTGNNRLHILTNDTAMETVDEGQAKRCQYLNSIATYIGQ